MLGNKNIALILKFNSDEISWKKWESLQKVSSAFKINFLTLDRFSDFIVVTANQGLVFLSSDRGLSWDIKKFSRNIDIQSVKLISPKEGILAGNMSELRYTKNAGETWNKVLVSKNNFNGNDILYDKDQKKFYVIGDEACFLVSKSGSLSDFNFYQNHSFKGFMIKIAGNFILPFLIIWLLFFLIYKVIPYASISNKAASLGAAFTSLAWAVFVLGFKVYAASFSKGTLIIYGSLAAVPLFLLLFYVSVLIMLFGVEISYFIQNTHEIKHYALRGSNIHDHKFWYTLEILYKLYSNHKQGKGGVKESALSKICNNNHKFFNEVKDNLIKVGWIEQTSDNKYLSSTDSSNIFLKDILKTLQIQFYHIPKYNHKNLFMKKADIYFKRIRDYESKTFANLKLSDLLDDTI